jgi:hypothetical protein
VCSASLHRLLLSTACFIFLVVKKQKGKRKKKGKRYNKRKKKI